MASRLPVVQRTSTTYFLKELFVCCWQHPYQRKYFPGRELGRITRKTGRVVKSCTAVLQPRRAKLLLQDAEQDPFLRHHLQQSWCSNPGPPGGRSAFGTARGRCATGWLSPAPWSCSGSWGAGVIVTLCCHVCGEGRRQRLMGMNWYTRTLVPVQISPLRLTRTVRAIWRYKCIITVFSFPETFFLTFKTGTVFLCYFILLLSLLLACKIIQRSDICWGA